MDKSFPPAGKAEEQETRERILSAARELMAKNGFKGATTRKIAQRAGVNEVTIFRHFKNKEGVLDALLEEISSVRPFLEKSVQGDFSSVKDLLSNYGRVFYNLLVRHKEIVMICMIEEESHPDLIGVFSRLPTIAVEVLAEKLQELAGQGKLQGEFCTAAHMLVATIMSAFMLRYRVRSENIPFSEEDLFVSVPEVLLHGLSIKE